MAYISRHDYGPTLILFESRSEEPDFVFSTPLNSIQVKNFLNSKGSKSHQLVRRAVYKKYSFYKQSQVFLSESTDVKKFILNLIYAKQIRKTRGYSCANERIDSEIRVVRGTFACGLSKSTRVWSRLESEFFYSLKISTYKTHV